MQNPPGHCNEEENNPSLKPPVRISVQQPNQYVPPLNEAPVAGAVYPEPNDTRDSVPPTPPALASSLEWTKVTSARPTENSAEYHDYAEDNGCPYDDNYDEDFIPVPRNMFELTPSIPPPTQTTTVMTVCFNKTKTTKPIPTSTLNNYAIFASDDADDINENDDEDTTNEVYTTELDLGSLANNNKNMPDDIFDDEASQVTVATKNSAKENQYAPKVPHGLPPKNYVPHGVPENQRPIDFDLFAESSEGS